jgi:hypothetical protein
MNMFLITLAVFGVAVLGMATGLILSGGRKQLKGSCGGPSANPNCCQIQPGNEACEEIKQCKKTPDEMVQLRSVTHKGSGHPVVSPNQMN